jgi:heme o synthase
MKATAHVQTIPGATVLGRNWLSVYADLFKARLTGLVLLTTLVGFYMGCLGPVDYVLLLHTILGTAMVASGAAALNQLWERDYDARMRRTRDRPLPSGRLQPQPVLWVGCALSLIGLVQLALAVNLLTSALGACSLVIYLFIYTPLKRITWLNTAVGAVPGGLPPLMGWTAAHGRLSAESWALFGILALWQLPHFMAIAWIYREEYARAGFKMLPVLDPTGRRTGRLAVACTLLLLPISLSPCLDGMAGPACLVTASLLGLTFVWCAVRFARELSVSRAKQLFFVSILYLPLLLAALVMGKAR